MDNYYLIRNSQTGEYCVTQMPDEMDAIYNLEYAHSINPKRISFGDPTPDEKDTECYEVINIMNLIEM